MGMVRKEAGRKSGLISAHQRHTETLVEFLADPGNEWLPKAELSTDVLGMADVNYVNKHWTPSQFEAEVLEPALRLRRQRYARASAQIDAALIARALEGDVPACKLFYQRLEGWNPSAKVEAKVMVSGVTLADVLNGEDCSNKG